MIPPHSFYGLFPDCWHILISLLRNRAMWRVACGAGVCAGLPRRKSANAAGFYTLHLV